MGVNTMKKRTPISLLLVLLVGMLVCTLWAASPGSPGRSSRSQARPGAGAGKNLLTNGNFEKWSEETGEPVGWHSRITSIIPVPEYADPEHKKGRTGKIHFKCGCRYEWGTVRPWVSLVCPQCKQINHGCEDSAALYDKNYESVVPVPGRAGKGVGMKITKAVGDVQGVRVISDLIKAERGAGYEISFDVMTKGTHPRVFVECFRLMPRDKKAREWVKTLPPEANPLGFTMRLKRRFRSSVNCEPSPTKWTHFSDRFVPPAARYEFDYMYVKLYGYLQGEVAFDNVVLRKLSDAEAEAYRVEYQPKDKRLRQEVEKPPSRGRQQGGKKRATP